MKYITKISVLIIAIIGFSCKKIIDLKPETVIENDKVINTLADLQLVLNGAYDGLQGANVLGGNMTVYSDYFADDADIRLDNLGTFGTSEIYNGNTSVQIGILRDMWRDCYSTINRANNVINFIDNNTKLSGPEFEAKKDKLKAEAIFIRAVVHFELLRFWALPYDKKITGNNIQPGIVIRTKPTTSIDSVASFKKPRATVEEVYDFVINQLKTASDMLTQKGIISSVGYASSSSCKAMLARVYYFKGDYENAINYAEQLTANTNSPYILKDSLKLIDNFRNQGFHSATNNEVIFEVLNMPLDNTSPLRNLYSRQASFFFRIPAATATSLYDVADYRLTKVLSYSTFGSSSTTKYDNPNEAATPNNVCYIRLAEMYLILAECKANTGDFTAALSNYNLLRKRLIKNYVDETSTDNLVNKIIEERRRELCFEGDRYMVLRKNGLPLKGGLDYKKYLFKIPQEEIAGNPDIVQN